MEADPIVTPSRRTPSRRYPLLDDFLAVVPKDCVLQAEIKGYSPQYADLFDAAVRKAGLTEATGFTSNFWRDAFAWARALASEVPVLL